ncbi:mCG1044743, partial [Mus musculus]
QFDRNPESSETLPRAPHRSPSIMKCAPPPRGILGDQRKEAGGYADVAPSPSHGVWARTAQVPKAPGT